MTTDTSSSLLWYAHIVNDDYGVTILFLSDLNGDDCEDIITGGIWGSLSALNGKNGKILWNHELGASVAKSYPAIGDLNNDGYPDVVFGIETGKVRALNGKNGSLIWEYRIPIASETAIFSPITIGDLDRDGIKEVVFTCFNRTNGIYALNGLNGTLTLRKKLRISIQVISRYMISMAMEYLMSSYVVISI